MVDGLELATAKMRGVGVNDAAIAIFADYYRQLQAGATGMVPESTIEPLGEVASLSDVTPSADDDEAFAKTVVMRLNGGLGTSMGLAKAKSLLEARDSLSFLDIIARQVLAARTKYGVRLPLVMMHSFNTQADSLAALGEYPELRLPGLPLDMLQSQEPKLLADSLTPVEWPAEPKLEWCPPGHGDLYPTLLASGILDQLIDDGFQYANVSNADNLGAAPSPVLAGWFARSGAHFAAEITRRTPMDVKGGHVAKRRSDGRLILRESAQTPAEDMKFFTDPDVHPYASTNNLWFDLIELRRVLIERGGVLGLPLIRNEKPVDPTKPESHRVIQIESAMGAAIEVFDKSTVIEVPRSRFTPVKTTNELALLRSDVYELDDLYVPVAQVDRLPVLSLSKPYSQIAGFDARFAGPLGLRKAESLTVVGDWAFGAGVKVRGHVTLGEPGGTIPDGTVLAD